MKTALEGLMTGLDGFKLFSQKSGRAKAIRVARNSPQALKREQIRDALRRD